MATGKRLGPAVEADEDVSAAAPADDGTPLTGDGTDSPAPWRPEDRDGPYVTFPFTAAPEDLR
ncbi:hypothetical protein [Streptomyces viridochromogenes]|uniref:Uncharacterized protein n=1 Tax=Streptomyces viridochromogenes Tue57 TaxID=1160705 RepID=L8P7X4_STRVR|nr:hypothetical protein [Streptomyces viridochromogenes]ELS52238.1 hypothetical protein STVIR_6803 [Streptomyces viridochromogenes Tue57]